MADDVMLNKAASIERYLARVSEEFVGHTAELETNLTRQDAIVLNLLRACEAYIDLAMDVVRIKRLGIPQTSRDAFDLLCQAGVSDRSLAERMANSKPYTDKTASAQKSALAIASRSDALAENAAPFVPSVGWRRL